MQLRFLRASQEHAEQSNQVNASWQKLSEENWFVIQWYGWDDYDISPSY